MDKWYISPPLEPWNIADNVFLQGQVIKISGGGI